MGVKWWVRTSLFLLLAVLGTGSDGWADDSFSSPEASGFPVTPSFEDQFFPAIGTAKIPRLSIRKWTVGDAQLKDGVCSIVLVFEGVLEDPSEERISIGRGKPIALSAAGAFRVKVAAPQPEMNIAWVLANSQGAEIARQVSKLQIGSWEQRCANPVVDVKGKKFKRMFDFGLGATAMTIRSSTYHPVSEIALTGKVSFIVPFPTPRWDGGINIFANIVPLWATDPSTARFLGVNARFGIVLPWKDTPWKIRILGGAYFLTMFVKNDDYFFKNVLGPQIFPAFSYTFRGEKTLGTYLKFSPIGNGRGFLSLYSREIATGLSFSFPAKQGKRPLMSISLDYTSVNVFQDVDFVKSQSLTLGASVGI